MHRMESSIGVGQFAPDRANADAMARIPTAAAAV